MELVLVLIVCVLCKCVYNKIVFEDITIPMCSTKSVKNDRKDNKLRWELLPLEDIEDLVKVYTKGAEKYGENNWQNLEDGYRRYKAAAFRHILEYEKGNEFDEETGCRHLAQAAWNLLACLHFSKKHT